MAQMPHGIEHLDVKKNMSSGLLHTISQISLYHHNYIYSDRK